MKRLYPLLALCLLTPCVLTGCKKAEPETLVSRLLFVANGSYDSSADQRVRLGKGMRRVQWSTKPPLDAQQVTVDYDSDQRPRAWLMTLGAPRLSTEELMAGGEHREVTTPRGPGVLVTSGQLQDVLVLGGQDEVRLMTHGYAAKYEPALAGAFEP